MDARRRFIAGKLDDPSTNAALLAADRASYRAERASAAEEGFLQAMLHEAVHGRHAKDNVTALLLRLDGGHEKTS